VKICRPGLAEELKVKNKNTITVSAKGLKIEKKFLVTESLFHNIEFHKLKLKPLFKHLS
jgi:hypothetical protein